MSLSRRRFTQEFKLSAVERLQQGASAAEVSRAFEPGFPFWPWYGHRIHPRCAEYHVFSR